MHDFALGILATISVIAIVWAIVASHSVYKVWKLAERRIIAANDRAHAAEIRAGQQIDTMLDRISTSPRLEVRTGVGTVDPAKQKYISDSPYMDQVWDDLRGQTEDDV